MLQHGKALIDAILHRAGEPSDPSSELRPAALAYLNRAYQSLAAGTSEFLPEMIDDWWWMRKREVLSLLPIFENSVTVESGSNQCVLINTAPVIGRAVLNESILYDGSDLPLDMTGWRMRVQGHEDIFVVTAHDTGNIIFNIDMPYTGEGGTFDCKLMKVEYALPSSVTSLISPMIGFKGKKQIGGMAPERLDELYPLAELDKGLPEAFALEDESTVRFSHGGPSDDLESRIEYRYQPAVSDLADTTSSIPLVPQPYRHLLVDMALFYMLQDKGDARVASIAAGARQGLLAMVRENRRRAVRMDTSSIGRVFPRQTGRRTVRTESGLVI